MRKLLAVCLLLCLLTGCMGSGTELKDLTVIQGIGVDKDEEEDEVNVSLQVFDAAKASGNAGELSGNLTKVVEGKGKSVYDAIYKSAGTIGDEPFVSQNRVVVLGENLAKSGIEGVTDYFFRDHETRINVTVAMCKGDAKDILNADTDEGLVPIETVENLIETSEKNLITPRTDIFYVLKSMYEAEGDYYITALKAEEEQDGGKQEKGGEGKSGSEEKQGDEPKKKVKTDGVGVFRDNKLTGYLDEEESKGLIWLNAKADGGIVIADCEPIGQITSEILKSKTKIEMSFEDEKPVCDISVECTLNIDEIHGGNEDEFTVEAIIPVQTAMNEKIAETISKTISRCVYDYNVDVFRLRNVMKNAYPNEFKAVEPQWREFIKTIEFRIFVNAEVVRAGEETVRK